MALLALGAVLLVAVGVMLLGWLFVVAVRPATTSARGSRIPACEQNLRQIGMAIHEYIEDNGHYPPAYVADDQGKPMHSWRVLLLPYLGYESLYDQYDFSKPWDSPENQQLVNRMPKVFACPADSESGPGETSYMVISGPSLLFHEDQQRRVADLKDGKAATIMVVEVLGMTTNWLQPRDLIGEELIWSINGEKQGLGSLHPQSGMSVLAADGSVWHFGDFVPPSELRAMATIDGGEPASPAAWQE